MTARPADFSLNSQPVSATYPVCKRCADVAVATILLIVGAPVLALIAFLVWRHDRGPVFFVQRRVGRDGKEFDFPKFRSMVVDADSLKSSLAGSNEANGPIFKIREDPRITPVGKQLRRLSLDELPQLWCVLKGEMSLVGPRPHLLSEIRAYPEYPLERLGVPPGLVCHREVGGRSELDFEAWIASDLAYVRSRTLAGDVRIFLKAIPAVFLCRGAY